MIVEFVGCTGSGKTTLIRETQRRLAETKRAVTMHEVVATRIGLAGITNPTARNLIQELVSFPYCLRSLGRHRAFIALSIRLFTRDSRLSAATIHNLRSLERKVGGYEMALRYDPNAIILVDEGPIQAVHMFAFTNTPPSQEEIAQFANLLPLPDLVVYVEAPVHTLVKRTLGRADPPRQMSTEDPALTERYVERATALFDRLIETENLRDRILIVGNHDRSRPQCEKLVDWLAESILNRTTAVSLPRYRNTVSQAT